MRRIRPCPITAAVLIGLAMAGEAHAQQPTEVPAWLAFSATALNAKPGSLLAPDNIWRSNLPNMTRLKGASEAAGQYPTRPAIPRPAADVRSARAMEKPIAPRHKMDQRDSGEPALRVETETKVETPRLRD